MPTYYPKDWEERSDVWALIAVVLPAIVLVITAIMVSFMSAHWAVDDNRR